MLLSLNLLILFNLFTKFIYTNSMALSCYAAEKNKKVILEVLKPRIQSIIDRNKANDNSSIKRTKILEIASGTGEHANLFASSLPDCDYQPTEPQIEMHESIKKWTEEFPDRVFSPIALDVNQYDNLDAILPPTFRDQQVDVMICINMIHISPFSSTESLFQVVDKCLHTTGFLLTYGPYRVNNFMVESNVNFDKSLRSRNEEWGIRDLEEVQKISNLYNLDISETVEMPSNNLCVVFRRKNIV